MTITGAHPQFATSARLQTSIAAGARARSTTSISPSSTLQEARNDERAKAVRDLYD